MRSSVLLKYPWPGNIRELRNVLERAMIMARGLERVGDRAPAVWKCATRRHGSGSPHPADAVRGGAEPHRPDAPRAQRESDASSARARHLRATLIKKIKEYGLEAKSRGRRGSDSWASPRVAAAVPRSLALARSLFGVARPDGRAPARCARTSY